MQTLKLANILRKYEGQWVALNNTRTEVLASGSLLENVLGIIAKLPISPQKPIVTFVSRFDADYVG